MFLLYPFYVVGSLFFTLLAYLISPILALLPDEDGNLPKWLYYFQTFDAPVPKGYWAGLKWLCRNPAYGFDLFLFGVDYDINDWKVYYPGPIFIFATNSKGAFSFKYNSPYWYIPAVKFGWKLFNFMRDGKPIEYGMDGLNRGRLPLCFSIVKP